MLGERSINNRGLREKEIKKERKKERRMAEFVVSMDVG